MLRPAKLYEEKLKQLYVDMIYDIQNQYYIGYIGDNCLTLSDNNWNCREYACITVDKAGVTKVIGFFRYSINISANSVSSIGIVSFDKGNPVFIMDIYYHIHELFIKYNMDRIEFSAYTDNPVIAAYHRFCIHCGGSSVGVKHQCSRLMDGKLHDMEEFEILKQDYLVSNMYTRISKRQ